MAIVLPEPIPVPSGHPAYDNYLTDQMALLMHTARNLMLTSRDGAIQNNDKAGNFSAVYCVFTSNGTANTEDTVPHTLGRVPLGYIVVNQNKAGVVYDGTTAWTASNIYLKTTVASVAWTLMVF